MAGKNKSVNVAQSLDEHYTSLEKNFEVKSSGDYEQLVVPNGNSVEPIHRWFHLKEAFSRRLLPRVLKDTSLAEMSTLRILDPFAGSGTTAVALSELVSSGELDSAVFVGVECNPFLRLVASAKLGAIQSPSPTFAGLARRIGATSLRKQVKPSNIPELATFRNPSYFDPEDLNALLRLRATIDLAEQDGADERDIHLARLCLGASIEPSSGLRRDGRALRFAPEKQRSNPINEFLRKAEQVEEDQPKSGLKVKGTVHLGDGRALDLLPRRSAEFDLILFSPPYPNNIDYTEVYKLEAWLLGYINSAEQFLSRRLATVYSHPSINRDLSNQESDQDFESLIAPLLAAVPMDAYATGRKLMIRGYANDMLKTLRSSFDRLREGGHLVFVVGNSVHGSGDGKFVIAADLIMAELARRVGFLVTSVEVARAPKRRGIASPYLRESVVFAEKRLRG
jgi:16S rRNA G966 N2-methylase RsmD